MGTDLGSKRRYFDRDIRKRTFTAALKVAEHAEAGAVIFCMPADTSERYLSTPLFADTAEEMHDAEEAISQSTPGYRIT